MKRKAIHPFDAILGLLSLRLEAARPRGYFALRNAELPFGMTGTFDGTNEGGRNVRFMPDSAGFPTVWVGRAELLETFHIPQLGHFHQ